MGRELRGRFWEKLPLTQVFEAGRAWLGRGGRAFPGRGAAVGTGGKSAPGRRNGCVRSPELWGRRPGKGKQEGGPGSPGGKAVIFTITGWGADSASGTPPRADPVWDPGRCSASKPVRGGSSLGSPLSGHVPSQPASCQVGITVLPGRTPERSQ